MTGPASPATASSLHGADRRRPAGRREAGERGLALAVESALLLPLILSVVWFGLQAALWWHARSTAIAAAQLGATITASHDSDPGAGCSSARSMIARADSLRNGHVDCSRTAATVTVRVTGDSVSLVPFWRPVVDETVTVPIERIT